MLSFIFYRIILASIIGGIVGLVFLALSRLSKKWFSVRWNYYIFLIPLLLMIIPFSFGFNLQSPNFSQVAVARQSVHTEQVIDVTLKDNNENAETPVTLEQLESQPEQESVDWNMAMNSLSFVWLGLSLILLFYKITIQVKFNRSLKKIAMLPTKEQLSLLKSMKKTGKVKLKMFIGGGTPFITGIFQPTIYVPETEMSDDEFCMVLKHELIHIKRHDLLYKRFADLISTIHFFNPVAYIIKNQIYKLCELSCDEQVTNSMNALQRKDYGKTILNLMKQNNLMLPSSAALCEGEKNIINRLELIMKSKKKSKFITFLSIVLVCALGVGSVVFASAVNERNTEFEAKATYQGQMLMALVEDGKYVTDYNTKDGTATYTNFMGITVFRASYFGMPEDKAIEQQTYFEEMNNNDDFEVKDFSEFYTDYYEISMDKKIRSFGDGLGIEGLFTLTKNNEIVFEKQTGYLDFLPPQNKNTFASNTELYISYEKDGKTYLLQANLDFEPISSERQEANNKQLSQFNNSIETKTIRLGEAEQIIINGENVDVSEINKDLESRDAWAYTVIKYNTAMHLAITSVPVKNLTTFTLAPGDKVSVNNDSFKGGVRIVNWRCVTDVVPMTVSGLNNQPGDFVEFKSDDGKYYAKYKIAPMI